VRPLHSSALALFGWYLMVPPQDGSNAMLWEWKVEASFDSAKACEDAKTIYNERELRSRGLREPTPEELREFEKLERELPPDTLVRNRALRQEHRADPAPACVPSDDSRLKPPFEFH